MENFLPYVTGEKNLTPRRQHFYNKSHFLLQNYIKIENIDMTFAVQIAYDYNILFRKSE